MLQESKTQHQPSPRVHGRKEGAVGVSNMRWSDRSQARTCVAT